MDRPNETPSKTPASGNVPKDARRVIRPAELQRIVEEKQRAALQRDLETAISHEEQEKELHRAFMERHLHPEAMDRFSEMVRSAAERGEQRIELVRFPSDWCTDRGRAINNYEEEWPTTLEGIAKEGYEVFDRWLRPLGYKISARVINYPGGKPGDVALYVSW